MHSGRRGLGALGTSLALLAAATACGGQPGDEGAGPAGDGERPNVVLVLTDDQRLEDVVHLPRTRALLGEAGTTFADATSPFPLCCPARASLLTGQLAHNHGVLDNGGPQGGVNALDNGETLAVWLQDAGYATAHVGKWLNGYGQVSPAIVPAGWDRWFTPIDPGTYQAYDYEVVDDGEVVAFGTADDDHQTGVLTDAAVDLVEDLAEGDRPFYLELAYVAPHSMRGPRMGVPGAPIPSPEHADAPVEVPEPDLAQQETDLSDKPAHVQAAASPPPDPDELVAVEEAAARSLLDVDAGVDAVVEALERSGELDDTIVVFTSDNGLLLGEHGQRGKVLPYEPSVRVPLLVRGPGFPPGVVDSPVMLADVTATVLDAAGVEPGLVADGTSLLEVVADPADWTDRAILLENGAARPDRPHYAGVRVDGWTYVEHSTGERELYDLEADPHQLESLHAAPGHAGVVRTLSALLADLATCAGEDCERHATVARP